ncbi:2-octaprenyl-6-methoxyphenol hydroxylase [Rhodovulum steppense]|uniref:2-octaprenyl-6-methoxyphenol hydroxylase n=2 Tax=Rhodovulum steppense TaxID=540251 RepID=A0A4R1YSX9_9RHOB|nr:2-octaprenyl-6-methoxyphenol hydroxylase [Rhodovulum steppense]
MDNPARAAILRDMERNSDILIVGGGLNGPALALALAQGGLTVTVIDALPEAARAEDRFDGRAYALALASTRLLRAIGIWDKLHNRSQPILEIVASDGRAGEGPAPFFLDFHHGEIEEGPMGYMLEDRYLRRAFLDAMAADPRITTISGETVIAQAPDATGVTVTLASGRTLRGLVLVGCDGRRSGTAERAGIRRTGWDYGQTALVCAIAHEHPHNGAAHQFFMPSGPLAILPLPGNRCSIVWSETHANAAAIQALDDAGYLAALRPRFGDFLGEIALEGDRFAYPLNLTLANAFVAPRIALLGDAAHGVHPIAGQGLNLGLRDVGALAQVLVEAKRRGEEIGAIDVLERYQTWRRFDTTLMAVGTDAVNKLFSNDNPILRLGRDLGMGAVNALPALRRRFIREAAGLTGDLPRLMTGRPL